MVKQKSSRRSEKADEFYRQEMEYLEKMSGKRKQEKDDPVTVVAYWILLPLFFALITVIALILISSAMGKF